jgi:O-methyltransferase
MPGRRVSRGSARRVRLPLAEATLSPCTLWIVEVKRVVGRPARFLLRKLGYELCRAAGPEVMPVDYDRATIDLFREVKPYTLTSHERVNALRQAVIYLLEAGVDGAFVECGVWRGGSMLVIAKTLVGLGATDRELYLFDTFTTMPPPGDEDIDLTGRRAADYYDEALAHPGFSYLPIARVRDLLLSTGYPSERLHFIQGMVEETIPARAPEEIALCRLDTDWYVSTKHEMEHLFWRIGEGGVLLVDDYGHFLGAKRAVDEVLAAIGGGVLLNRIDYSGRLAIVTADTNRRAISNATSCARVGPR